MDLSRNNLFINLNKVVILIGNNRCIIKEYLFLTIHFQSTFIATNKASLKISTNITTQLHQLNKMLFHEISGANMKHAF